MNKEKLARREFLLEAGAFIWAAAAMGSIAEGCLRYSRYEQRVIAAFPEIEEARRRKIIVQMSIVEGELWKDQVEFLTILGFISAFLIAAVKMPGAGPMISR